VLLLLPLVLLLLLLLLPRSGRRQCSGPIYIYIASLGVQRCGPRDFLEACFRRRVVFLETLIMFCNVLLGLDAERITVCLDLPPQARGCGVSAASHPFTLGPLSVGEHQSEQERKPEQNNAHSSTQPSPRHQT
jgi:hypothetical protein